MGRAWSPLSSGQRACAALAVWACGAALLGLAIGPASGPPFSSVLDAQPGVAPSDAPPDLVPTNASSDPEEPREGQVVVVRVTILNQGGTPAEAATVDVFDDRSSGSSVHISRLNLPGPLGPEASIVLSSDAFFAVGIGDHTVRIRIGNVSPEETSVEDNDLALSLTVRPAAGLPPPPPDDNPDGFDLEVSATTVTMGFSVGAVVVIALAVFLLRPRRPEGLEPPPPEPPDRSPPPLWPP